jgi:hypothetical protein
MLLKLMTGKALPAGELALAANVSAQTASEHLAKLTAGSILLVERQGRHRYYRLAGAEVADAVEALLRLTSAGQSRESERAAIAPSPGSLAHARTCYSHIAGWLGVRIADALQKHGYLLPAEAKAFRITDAGRLWLAELGISLRPTDGKASPQIARQCLDWTERRPHMVKLRHRLPANAWTGPNAVLTLPGHSAFCCTSDSWISAGSHHSKARAPSASLSTENRSSGDGWAFPCAELDLPETSKISPDAKPPEGRSEWLVALADSKREIRWPSAEL